MCVYVSHRSFILKLVAFKKNVPQNISGGFEYALKVKHHISTPKEKYVYVNTPTHTTLKIAIRFSWPIEKQP